MNFNTRSLLKVLLLSLLFIFHFSCSKDTDLLTDYVLADTSDSTETTNATINFDVNNDYDTIENISALLALAPINGLGMNVLGYYASHDGGGGVFKYDETRSDTNDGGTIIDGWVRQYDGSINVRWFGAKGDGIKDDSKALQAALDVGGSIILDKATYKIGTQLSINQPCSIDLNGATITSSTIMRLIAVKKNTVLKNGNITTTYTSSSQSLFGIIEAMNVSLDFLTLQDLFINGGSNSEIDGIKVDCTVNNSIIKDITIENVVIENIGIMGVEIISHTASDDDLNHVQNVIVNNLKTKNTGTISVYGMGISISGGVRRTIINGIIVDDYKDIGIENAGGRIFSVNDFKVTDPKLTATDIAVSIGDSALHTSNENTQLSNGEIIGDVKIDITTNASPIVLNEIYVNGISRFDTKNVVINNSNIILTGPLQSIAGGKLIVNNSNITFGTETSRFQTTGASQIELYKVDATRSDDGQMIFIAEGGSLKISYSKFTDGYINISTGVIGTISNTSYTRQGSGTGFIGLGSYNFSFVYCNGILIDN